MLTPNNFIISKVNDFYPYGETEILTSKNKRYFKTSKFFDTA